MVMTGTSIAKGKSFAKRTASNVVAAARWLWRISPFSPKDKSGSYTTTDRIASLLAEQEAPKTPRFVPRVPFFARPNPSKRKPRLKPLTLSAEKREEEKHADLEKLLSPDLSDHEDSGGLDTMLRSPDAFIDVNSDVGEGDYTSPSLYSQRSPSSSSSRWSKDTTEMLVKPIGVFISPRTVYREQRDERVRKVSLVSWVFGSKLMMSPTPICSLQVDIVTTPKVQKTLRELHAGILQWTEVEMYLL